MLLLGPHGLETVGVPIMVDGRYATLFARLTDLLSDGDGLSFFENIAFSQI